MSNLPLLASQDMKVLKVIRVKINRDVQREMTGFLLYARPFTSTYNEGSTDDVDEIIISSIKEDYPDSSFIRSPNIEHYRRGHQTKDYSIDLKPEFTCEDRHNFEGVSFPEFKFKFKLYLNPYHEPLDVAFIRNFTTHSIPIVDYQNFGEKFKTFIEIK